MSQMSGSGDGPAGDPLDALGYDDHLPLRWRPEETPGAATMDRRNLELVATLAALSALEEVGGDPGDDDGHATHDLLRLENKVDLLLMLVGRLMLDQLELPPPRSLTLRAGSVEWRGNAENLEAGDTGVVTLYVNPEIPLPLRLTGRVHRIGEAVAVVFEGLTEQVSDALAKFVFRHHRRQVARAREQR